MKPLRVKVMRFSPPSFAATDQTHLQRLSGYWKPLDIIQWLNYLQNDSQFSALNTSNSGIVGISMGGLYSLNTYILESLGQGRIKACVDISGPTNLTREIAYLTNNPTALGDVSLTEELAEKNPINQVNSTFPKNLLIMHGTDDPIVDYRCSEDLNATINPYNNRTDMEFIPFPGLGHTLGGNETCIQKTVAWIDYYVSHSITNKDNFTSITPVQQGLYDSGPANNGQSDLFKTVLYFCVIIPLFLYTIKPKLFTPNQTVQQNILLPLTENALNEKTRKKRSAF